MVIRQSSSIVAIECWIHSVLPVSIPPMRYHYFRVIFVVVDNTIIPIAAFSSDVDVVVFLHNHLNLTKAILHMTNLT